MNKIIVVGSSNTDMVIKAERLPAPGETVLGGSFMMNPGGKGANQAVAAARLGSRTVFVCKTGDDIFGKQAMQQFQQEGMVVDYIFTDTQQPSGIALINVDSKGENSITVASGANASLSKKEIEKAQECFEKDDILLVQLETPIPTVEFALEKAREKGLRTILNPAPATSLPKAIYPLIDYITPNESEAEILTGVLVHDTASADEAAGDLLRKGVKCAIITMGAQVAYIKSADFEKMVATTKVNAVDTTAAGDCFSGALAVALSEGKEVADAVAFACRAASISVTRMGAQASIPMRTELI